jgi:hypothetical protein
MTRLLTYHKLLKKTRATNQCSSPYNTTILAVQKKQINKNSFKTSSSLMKQSSPFTQLSPIPILYWLNTLKSPVPLWTRFKECFLLHTSASRQSASVCLYPINFSQQLASQLVVLLEQHMELGFLGNTSGWPLFMLLLTLLFEPSIINAFSRFISP